MNYQYFLRQGNENIGPLSAEAWRQRGFRGEEFVWREGLDDWMQAEQLPEWQQLIAGPAASTANAAAAGDPQAASRVAEDDDFRYQPDVGAPLLPSHAQPARQPHTSQGSASPYVSPQAMTWEPTVPAPSSSKTSVLGIISLAIGVLVVFLYIATFVFIISMGADAQDLADDDPRAMVVGGLCCFGFLGNLTGAILGLAALFQNTSKIFPILGLVANGVIILGVGGLMLIGLAAG